MVIYKLLRSGEWAALAREGETAGSPADRADGFIHFSTAAQLPGTLAKHFAGEAGLVLAAADAGGLGDALRWEAVRGGQLFPHLYRALRLSDLLWHRVLGEGPQGAELPGGLA